MEASWLIIILLLVLLCLSVLIIITRIRSSSINLPPGPIYIPFITDILLLPKISFSQLKPILHDLHANGPIISFHVWSIPHIFIFDRSLAHKALIQNASVFANRPKSINNNIQLNISSSCYGSTWRVLRNNLASTMLHPSQFKSFSKTRTRVLDTLLNELKFEAKAMNNSVKLINHIQHAIFILLVFMCFGENVDNKKMENIKNIQKCLISSSGKFGALNFYPKIVSRVLFRKRWQDLSQLRKFQNDLLVELIHSRKKIIENNNYDGYVVCYVDTLLNLQLLEEKRKLDEGEIVALCSEFLTAGTDTTSTTIEWVMANLVKYKHIQERLVEEIEDIVGDGREKMEVREEDLEKLPYLKALILEGLRRHPPSHYAIPHAVTEDVILNGYLIPKNGTVNFMVADIGLDPTVWKDPMVFKPDRFLKDETSSDDIFEAYDVRGKTEIKRMPFGAGRRICPAHKLAMLHLEYFVANLVLNFEWETLLSTDNVDLSEKQEFTMVMKHPLQARISQRN